MDKSLSIAFGDSLQEEVVGSVTDLLEVGLDSILEEGLLKDIPILSTTVAVYKIGTNFKDRYNLKKLIVFIDEINKGIVDETSRKKYQEKFQKNDKFRNQELEYILVLIDRYISYDKPKMLSKLYLAYLREEIIWTEFTMYAEVVDRFLPGDYEMFIPGVDEYITYRNIGSDSILRLVALGLLAEESSYQSLFTDDGMGGFAVTTESMNQAKDKKRIYKKTEFGEGFAKLFSWNQLLNGDYYDWNSKRFTRKN